MDLKKISFNQITVKSYSLWEDKWLLLTAGDYDTKKFNCMTISWGSLGVMWNKPYIQVVVRPTRYTFQFINEFPDFTVCAFPEKYHKVLQTLGSKSGRKIDKIGHSGLTPFKPPMVAAPAYEEAELIFQCHKIYWQDLDPEHFLDPKSHACYTNNDYHRSFYGEILAINGVDEYSA